MILLIYCFVYRLYCLIDVKYCYDIGREGKYMNKDKQFHLFNLPDKFDIQYLCYSDQMGFLDKNDFVIERKNFDNYLIMYVCEGILYVQQEGVKYKINKGQYILMSLIEWHKYYFDKQVYSSIIWIHMNGNPVREMIHQIMNSRKMPVLGESKRIPILIRKCFEATKRVDGYKKTAVSAAIYEILSTVLYEAVYDNSSTKNKRDYEFKMAVSLWIEQNIYNDITLDMIAEWMNISKYHFLRLFKRSFGVTPKKYIMEEKIRLAQNMLIYTDDDINTISHKLSFSSQSYFSKVFKKETSLYPTHFRHNYR